MPALIGGFFRRGQTLNVQQAHICSDHSPIGVNGLGLNNAVKSNEVWLWGIAKWEKNRSSIYSSTLPECQEVIISLTKVNLHFKDGSTIPNQLIGNGLEFSLTEKKLSRSVTSLIRSGEYTITEGDLYINPGENRLVYSLNKPDSLKSKRGNPVQKILPLSGIGIYDLFHTPSHPGRGGLRFCWGHLILKWLSCTYPSSKRKSEVDSQYGGKITEKANAKSNFLDTGNIHMTRNISGLLLSNSRLQNSASLIKVLPTQFGRRYSSQDLEQSSENETNVIDRKEASPDGYQSFDPNWAKEMVEEKQIELVRLAEQYGLYDNRVYDRQLLLIRSLNFRKYTAWIILNKPGSQTAGIDKESVKPEDKEEVFQSLVKFLRDMVYHPNKYQPSAIKRVWIPKPGKDEKRPQGIPTIKDRSLQALVNMVLYPLVEMTSDPNSYGFRSNRDCKFAIAALRSKLKSNDLTKIILRDAMGRRFERSNPGQYYKSNQEKWILDADIKGFFDNINHEWIIQNLFLHPKIKGIVQKWLKARIFDNGKYTDPLTGTPQGGIISPTLANFTLNGLEEKVLKSIYAITKSREQRKTVKLRDGRMERLSMMVSVVRYADDFIVLARSKNVINKFVNPAITEFLRERGLWLSPQKTKIFSLAQKNTQLDFLGYTFKYQDKWAAKRTMVYGRDSRRVIALYPNRDKVINFINKLKEIIKSSKNLSAMELISKLNPIIRGWAQYYNMENSSRYRSMARNALYNIVWDWMREKHPTLGKKKLANMYFLTTKKNIDEIDADSPNPESNEVNTSLERGNKVEYVKFKNTKWVFHGVSKTESRYSKESKTRVTYLLNPIESSPNTFGSKIYAPSKS